jgi:hypothetical protein
MIAGFDHLEFFRGFVNHAGVTLHIDNLRGTNAHHQCETCDFQGWPRAAHVSSTGAPLASFHRPRAACWRPITLSNSEIKHADKIVVVDYGMGDRLRSVAQACDAPIAPDADVRRADRHR